jgi:hypothetical protein
VAQPLRGAWLLDRSAIDHRTSACEQSVPAARAPATQRAELFLRAVSLQAAPDQRLRLASMLPPPLLLAALRRRRAARDNNTLTRARYKSNGGDFQGVGVRSPRSRSARRANRRCEWGWGGQRLRGPVWVEAQTPLPDSCERRNRRGVVGANDERTSLWTPLHSTSEHLHGLLVSVTTCVVRSICRTLRYLDNTLFGDVLKIRVFLYLKPHNLERYRDLQNGRTYPITDMLGTVAMRPQVIQGKVEVLGYLRYTNI